MNHIICKKCYTPAVNVLQVKSAFRTPHRQKLFIFRGLRHAPAFLMCACPCRKWNRFVVRMQCWFQETILVQCHCKTQYLSENKVHSCDVLLKGVYIRPTQDIAYKVETFLGKYPGKAMHNCIWDGKREQICWQIFSSG